MTTTNTSSGRLLPAEPSLQIKPKMPPAISQAAAAMLSPYSKIPSSEQLAGLITTLTAEASMELNTEQLSKFLKSTKLPEELAPTAKERAELLTPKQAAQLLKVSKETLRQMRLRGIIPTVVLSRGGMACPKGGKTYRVGGSVRIPLSAIQKLIDQGGTVCP